MGGRGGGGGKAPAAGRLTLWEYAARLSGGRPGPRVALMLAEESLRGRLRLRDPSPPQSFLEYLSRPDYALWAWAAAALEALAAAAALLGAPTPLRLLLGLPAVLLVPGYAAARLMYPEGRRPVEELLLSLALSIALVPPALALAALALGGLGEGVVVAATSALALALLAPAAYRSWLRTARGAATA